MSEGKRPVGRPKTITDMRAYKAEKARIYRAQASVGIRAALFDLVDLIEKVAPEYAECPMVSNARDFLYKPRKP